MALVAHIMERNKLWHQAQHCQGAPGVLAVPGVPSPPGVTDGVPMVDAAWLSPAWSAPTGTDTCTLPATGPPFLVLVVGVLAAD